MHALFCPTTPVQTGKVRLINFNPSYTGPELAYGPKYLAPSLATLRANKIRGNSSLTVIRIYRYDLSSRITTLKFGRYFLINSFSSNNASSSFFTAIVSILWIRSTNAIVLGLTSLPLDPKRAERVERLP